MNYCGYVTKITKIEKHPNADRLQIGRCFGNQVIIDLNVKENDIGVYFPSDGQLSNEYCKVNNLVRKKDEQGKNIGGYLDPNKRHIRALKLRGQISDGLFMPLESLASFIDISTLAELEMIDVLNGVEICKKYIPVMNGVKQDKTRGNPKKKTKMLNRFSYPIFHEHIDTKQLMYNLGQFNPGDVCYITLKMHGTSARTSNTLVKHKKYYRVLKKKIYELLKKKPYTEHIKWATTTGTRRVILKSFEGGYHGDNNFRGLYHKLFEGKLFKGETIYYEIVGYTDRNKPIMGTVKNSKTNDKEFLKKYGEKTVYSYGCEEGQSDIYIYRMTLTNEDGYEIDYPWDLVKTRAEYFGVKTVPELERFIFTTEEDLLNRVESFCGGVDPVGKTHIREGIVIRIEGKERFKALKHKNEYFKILEGIIKDAGVIDAEEAEEIRGEDDE